MGQGACTLDVVMVVRKAPSPLVRGALDVGLTGGVAQRSEASRELARRHRDGRAIGPAVSTLNFWCQSRIGLVDATSRDVLLASDVIGSDSDAVASTVAADLADGAKRYFGAEVWPAMLGPGERRASCLIVTEGGSTA